MCFVVCQYVCIEFRARCVKSCFVSINWRLAVFNVIYKYGCDTAENEESDIYDIAKHSIGQRVQTTLRVSCMKKNIIFHFKLAGWWEIFVNFISVSFVFVLHCVNFCSVTITFLYIIYIWPVTWIIYLCFVVHCAWLKNIFSRNFNFWKCEERKWTIHVYGFIE